MGIHYRQYKSYQDYLQHQRSKLSRKRAFFQASSPDRYSAISHRIQDLLRHLPEKHVRRVLCLGARLGEEVKAFIDLGYANALGIDLNPGLFNKYVRKGDFHNLKFADGSIDIIYSNCLDHALDLEKVASEIKRVLANDGHLCIELSTSQKLREREHLLQSNWESMIWESYEDVVAIFSKDFRLLSSSESFDRNYISYAFQRMS